MKEKITTFFFDWENTLIDIRKLRKKAFLEVLRWLKKHRLLPENKKTDVEYEITFQEIYDTMASNFVSSQLDSTQFRKKELARRRLDKLIVKEFLSSIDVDVTEENLRDIVSHFQDAFSNYNGLFAEVYDVLQELRTRGFILGIISNGYRPYIEKGMKSYDIDKFFSVVVTPYDVATKKPDVGIFQEALNRANCTPTCAVMVGDSVEEDIVGAQKLGMLTILLRRNEKSEKLSPDARPDFCVEDLKQIFQLPMMNFGRFMREQESWYIEEVANIVFSLERAKVKCVLFGGMGLALYLKHLYRKFDDIDLAISLVDTEPTMRQMTRIGYDCRFLEEHPNVIECQKDCGTGKLLVHIVTGSLFCTPHRFQYDFEKIIKGERKVFAWGKMWPVIPIEDLLITMLFVPSKRFYYSPHEYKKVEEKWLFDIINLLSLIKKEKLDLRYVMAKVKSDLVVNEVITKNLQIAVERFNQCVMDARKLLRCLKYDRIH